MARYLTVHLPEMSSACYTELVWLEVDALRDAGLISRATIAVDQLPDRLDDKTPRTSRDGGVRLLRSGGRLHMVRTSIQEVGPMGGEDDKGTKDDGQHSLEDDKKTGKTGDDIDPSEYGK
ncbi:hypothetical protein [Amycolatopsis nigrescens]|uniref:hypothetical protein n=1 Tax=Amycolatopsis nigrescens TaxID=381445 RepID=UPI000363716C|nr:hypothetical protein [Amycolatopsis nigrescens]